MDVLMVSGMMPSSPGAFPILGFLLAMMGSSLEIAGTCESFLPFSYASFLTGLFGVNKYTS